MSNLILPQSVAVNTPTRENVSAPVTREVSQIPQEVQDKLESIQETLNELTSSDHGILALCENAAFRNLLQVYVNKISASLSQSLIRSDRERIISILGEVAQNREIYVKMKKETLVLSSYQIGISDCINILKQTPPPQYTVRVGNTKEEENGKTAETTASEG